MIVSTLSMRNVPMITKKYFLFVTALLSFMLTLGILSLPRSEAVENAEIGMKAPDFSLSDVNGKSHTLSDYAGKIVVLEWTNPNCPFVKRVYGEGIIPQLQSTYTKKNVIWLAVNSTNASHQDYREPASQNESYAKWNAHFTSLLIDKEGTVGKLFHAKTTPHIFIIDTKQVLVYAGALDDDPRGNKTEKTNYVARALDDLLGGKPLTTATTTSYGCSIKY
jgi:glutathione peroxidase-family protein